MTLYYLCSENKVADQLRDCAFAFVYEKMRFSHDAAHLACLLKLDSSSIDFYLRIITA